MNTHCGRLWRSNFSVILSQNIGMWKNTFIRKVIYVKIIFFQLFIFVLMRTFALDCNNMFLIINKKKSAVKYCNHSCVPLQWGESENARITTITDLESAKMQRRFAIYSSTLYNKNSILRQIWVFKMILVLRWAWCSL